MTYRSRLHGQSTIWVTEHFDSNVLVDQANLNFVEVRVGVSLRRFQFLFQTMPDKVVRWVAAECGSRIASGRKANPRGRA